MCLQDGHIPWRSNHLLQPPIAALEMSTEVMGSPQGHMQTYHRLYSLCQLSSDQGTWSQGLYRWLVSTANICHSCGCIMHRPHLFPPFHSGWQCSHSIPYRVSAGLVLPDGIPTSWLTFYTVNHHCQHTIASFPNCGSDGVSFLFKCFAWSLHILEGSPTSQQGLQVFPEGVTYEVLLHPELMTSVFLWILALVLFLSLSVFCSWILDMILLYEIPVILKMCRVFSGLCSFPH